MPFLKCEQHERLKVAPGGKTAHPCKRCEDLHELNLIARREPAYFQMDASALREILTHTLCSSLNILKVARHRGLKIPLDGQLEQMLDEVLKGMRD